MKIVFDYQAAVFEVELMPSGKSYRALIGDRAVEVETVGSDREAAPPGGEARLDLLIDGKRVTAYVSADRAKRWVTVDGQTYVMTKSSGARRGAHGHAHAAGALLAPMPGQIRVVYVSEGETVARGQTLLVLEAMKMEIRVQAPTEGIVKKLFVKQGQAVEREQILIEIEDN